MFFDTLEDRKLLAVVYAAATAELRLAGTFNVDTFTISQMTIGATPFLQVVDNGVKHNFNLAIKPVNSISAFLREGNDILFVQTKTITVPISVDGSIGNDLIDLAAGNDSVFGREGDDTIYGYGGNDTIYGSFGRDLIYGGVGDDYVYGELDNDSLYGDAGKDYIEGGDDSDDFIDGGTEDDTLHGNQGNDTLFGMVGNDLLYGDDNVDFIDGGSGLDTLYGGNHEDFLLGGEDKDTMYGDADNDILAGGNADDALYGGAGNDNLSGEIGSDTIFGDGDDDTVFGGDDADVLNGGAGRDTLSGDQGADVLHGDAGNDSLNGGDGADDLFGDDGADNLSGDADDDRLHGGNDGDTLNGNNGNDAIFGDAGADVLEGGDGLDGLYGGVGDTDTITGGAGADRFLDRYELVLGAKNWDDDVTDRQNEDAIVGFKDDPNDYIDHDPGNLDTTYGPGAWSNSDIELFDVALEILHLTVGNVTLLEQNHGSTLEFIRSGDVITTDVPNVITYAQNTGGHIRVFESTFSGSYQPAQVALHEIGHHWDQEYDKNGWWALSGWEKANSAPTASHVEGDEEGYWYDSSIAVFNSDYGRTNPNEDFSECFAEFFMTKGGLVFDPQGSNPVLSSIPDKQDFFDTFLASIQ
jgi:Ca2+-binding RTX toxin-like protein